MIKIILVLILFSGVLTTPAFAQDVKNPSLIINTIEIPATGFHTTQRDAPIVKFDKIHAVSWQVTIDNNLIYSIPDGNAVLRLYDAESQDRFVEVGMGSIPDNKFWVAVQTLKEGYVVVHSDLERGWYPEAKSIISFTDRAGLTVNNGARIVVTNLDIGEFAIGSYAVHGMEGSIEPPAANSGIMSVEFLSGDPAKNVFAFFPFYMAAGIGTITGIMYLTKKRS
ncbi:hypothetical protein AAA799E16_00618 [Marine Group I thaumarchaeote SCGC AAA799-E16]|uniref:Uncharacterized protein n=4 Tax=Marine Group I TaxID=905826 RepID=A0A087RWY1_9ARCH|nr:hypothetical protein AAA799E16_00618 [Marine Group I thaumarchaeote SCGC AAA799-E16]KFM16172.1 hypothetical protein AAA799D11_00981 [Marine Group I thaumarchaeote SCGC AAA799-D11]KFM17909.1 hypothetical protein SCCGRSA3_01859 [Marine Group I thaumarchaeote SCGC RSA3]KFM17985.1 hypothetical protein AAA799P11_01250 [Marine Group I thaumarchaeote SCGC AAA799-P11]